ncbi:MAG: STT3 domain-containing protein [Nanoarchaeota archaeon]|nr:STT3 domain-containing protein [Nanoarchaeota archaeon]
MATNDEKQEISSHSGEQEHQQNHQQDHSSTHHSSKLKDDDIIDFSRVKHAITHFFKNLTKKESGRESENSFQEENSPAYFSLTTTVMSVKKHSRWLIPLLCILIAMSLSIYLRTMPQRLPVTEQWAQQPVYNFYRDQIVAAVDKQNPHLPPNIKDSMVEKEWVKVKTENAKLLQDQITDLSKQYQDMFRDDTGTLYLLGIDPYYYYRQSYYVLKNGFPGSEMNDGVLWDSYRLAPIGREAEWNFHNWFGAVWHRIMNLFGDFSLLYTFFFVGTVFSALTVIPGFFIGKRLTQNNVGGFFVAILLASSAFFVSRTTGESSDTDVYAVFFPVLITWLFIEALEAKTMNKKMVWMALAAFSTGVFSFAWTGWWYIAVFIIATQLVHLLYLLFNHRKTIAVSFRQGILSSPLYLVGLYIGLSVISISLFTTRRQSLRLLLGPLQFLKLKAVAVKTAWPNIRTTVAELNVVPLDNVIAQLGGKFLFFLAILGILFLLLRKNKEGKRDIHYSFFLAVWLIASLYATSKGVRFILQATPVFSIALGVCLGMVWDYGSQWTSRHLKVPKLIAAVVFFVAL